MSFFDFCWEIENLLKNLINVNSKSTGMSKAHTYQRLFECQSIDGFEGIFDMKIFTIKKAERSF